jgi:outer membrane immunogenic protein
MLIGLGIEYAFAPNLSAKFEADYLGFSAKLVSFNENITGGSALPPFSESQSSQQVLFKVGLNYKFGGW